VAIDVAYAAAAFVAGPGRVNALAAARVERAHGEMQGGAHAADLVAQERVVRRPQEVLASAADEVEVVDAMARVAGRVKRLEDERGGSGVVEAEPQLGDGPVPLGMAVHGDHGTRFGGADVGQDWAGRGRAPRTCGIRRREVHAALRGKLGRLARGPFDVAGGAVQFRSPPIEPQPGRNAGVDGEVWRGRRSTGFREFQDPTLLADLVAVRTGQLPAVGCGRRTVVACYARAAKMPADATGLRPERERPAFRVSEAVVLVRVHVALGAHLATGEGRGPTAAHRVQLGAAAACGPERAHGHPLVPERDQRARRLVVQPVQGPHAVQLRLMSGHNEAWKVVGDGGCTGGRSGRSDGGNE